MAMPKAKKITAETAVANAVPATPEPKKPKARKTKKEPKPYVLPYNINRGVPFCEKLALYRSKEEAIAYVYSEVERLIQERKPILTTLLNMDDEDGVKQLCIDYLHKRDLEQVTKRGWKLMLLPDKPVSTVDCNGFPVEGYKLVVKVGMFSGKTDPTGHLVIDARRASSWTGKDKDRRMLNGEPVYQTVEILDKPTAVTLNHAILALMQHGHRIVPITSCHRKGTVPHPWLLVEAP